jgi:hypothetical protein
LNDSHSFDRLLFEASKGVEVTVGAVYRKYGQIMLAFEELLNETNTFKEPTRSMDIISKNKLSDTGTRTRRGTISGKDKMLETNMNVNWQENRKNVEIHNKRFEILEKFSFETAEDGNRDDDLFLSQFGDDFS